MYPFTKKIRELLFQMTSLDAHVNGSEANGMFVRRYMYRRQQPHDFIIQGMYNGLYMGVGPNGGICALLRNEVVHGHWHWAFQRHHKSTAGQMPESLIHCEAQWNEYLKQMALGVADGSEIRDGIEDSAVGVEKMV